MNPSPEPTYQQKKQFDRWALTRYFGCGLGGIGVITALLYGWRYHWVSWLLLPAAGALMAGVNSHKHMRAHPNWYPPEPTEAERHRAQASQYEGDVTIVGGGIAFFSVVIAVSTGVWWFLFGVPVGVGFGYMNHRIAKSEYAKARMLEGKPTSEH